MPRVTIGMAHYEDYDGVYFTIQHLQSLGIRPGPKSDYDFLVVDQSPDSPHGQAVAGLMANIGARYVPFPEPRGTSPSRNQVFAEATGDVVLCLDCHVVLMPGAVQTLTEFYDGLSAKSPDMVSGPMLADNCGLYATHFNDQWRAEMWGTWGVAWECSCDTNGAERFRFSVIQTADDQTRFVALLPPQPTVRSCPTCGRRLPESLGWAGHEAHLVAAGWRLAVAQGHPFEVPGMGLGCFAMRRTDWVGFNQHARVFGGEELYVHAKVRSAGGRVWCLPALGWMHRFGRPGGAQYFRGVDPSVHKVRNYVLEFQEMGWDVTPIREHFRQLPGPVWEALVADPINFAMPAPQTAAAVPVPAAAAADNRYPPPGDHNLDSLFRWCKVRKRDLDQHADKIRELASQVSRIVAVVKRREWDVFLLAGRPDHLHVYQTEVDPLSNLVADVVQRTEVNPRAPRRVKTYSRTPSHQIAEMEHSDLLVIDAVHHGDVLYQQLIDFAPRVSRWILLRGTALAGETSEDRTGPGLLPALRRYMREHPEWSVVYHTATQYGLTLISKLNADKPQLPGVITMAANFAKALAEHVADHLEKVTPDELHARLERCSICDQRRDDRCTACGCFTAVKAAWRSSDCPLGRWQSGPSGNGGVSPSDTSDQSDKSERKAAA